MILHISVIDKIATYRKRDGDIVCGNSDYQIQFAFDSEWDAHEKKTARLIYNGQYIDVPIDENGICELPAIRNATTLQVGVYSDDESLHTTTPASIGCRKSILCGTKKMQSAPENDMDYASEARQAAIRAEASAKEAEHWASVAKENGDTGGGATFTTDHTLSLKDGVLKVNTASEAEADNTLPITAAAVNTAIGNIDVLLQTI